MTTDFQSLMPANITKGDEAKLSRYNAEYVRTAALPSIVFLGILMVAGLVANSLVCVAYCVQMRYSTQGFLMMLLCTFQLLVCALGMPGEVVILYFQYIFPHGLLCRLIRFANSFCIYGPIVLLVVIAVDRCREMCYPFGWQISPKHGRGLTTFTLLLAFILASPSLILSGIKTKRIQNIEAPAKCCDISEGFRGTWYQYADQGLFAVVFVTLVVTLGILYIRIWRQIQRRHQQEREDQLVRISTISHGLIQAGSASSCQTEIIESDDTLSPKRLPAINSINVKDKPCKAEHEVKDMVVTLESNPAATQQMSSQVNPDGSKMSTAQGCGKPGEQKDVGSSPQRSSARGRAVSGAAANDLDQSISPPLELHSLTTGDSNRPVDSRKPCMKERESPEQKTWGRTGDGAEFRRTAAVGNARLGHEDRNEQSLSTPSGAGNDAPVCALDEVLVSGSLGSHDLQSLKDINVATFDTRAKSGTPGRSPASRQRFSWIPSTKKLSILPELRKTVSMIPLKIIRSTSFYRPKRMKSGDTRHASWRLKGTVTAMAITVTFFFSYLPVLIILILRRSEAVTLETGAASALFTLLSHFPFLTTLLYPLTYAVINSQVRNACRRLFHSIFPRTKRLGMQPRLTLTLAS